MLVTNLTFGGAEAQVARLAGELKTRGWEVAVVCLTEPDAHVNEIESQGISIHRLRIRRRFPDPRAIFRLCGLIKCFRPDVVHCHMFHANLLGRITRIFCRIPALVCTVHNLRETSERGGPTWHKERLYRLTDGLADQTTVICKAAFDRYVQVGAVPQERLRVIPNFIDTQYFSPQSDRRIKARRALGFKKEFVWLAVGRLVKQKDYPNLLRAVHKLGTEPMTMVVAGGGPLAGELRDLLIRLELPAKVRFLGTSESILDLYNAADAFVMSSQFEGLSVALLEASSMALPAVVTDAGGNAEIVRHEATGYVVPRGDPTALSDAMRQMMRNPEPERRAMGQNARAVCIGRYRTGIVVQQWLDLYTEVRLQNLSPHRFTPSSKRDEKTSMRRQIQ
ncbi:MAG: glycosyltransferase [Terracidiphilus sp.]